MRKTRMQRHVSGAFITQRPATSQLQLPTILLDLTSARFSISHLLRIFMAKTLSVFLTLTTATWREDRGGVSGSAVAAEECEAR